MPDKNIIKSVSFVAVFTLLAFILNGLLVFGLRHYRAGAGFDVLNQIMEGKAGADILISGSSRALIDFDCQSISKVTGRTCFNIGIDGGHVNLELPLLKTYFKHNTSPKILVEVVGLTDLEIGAIFRGHQYVPYLNEDEIYKSLVSLDPEFRYYKYVPMYAFTVFNQNLFNRALKGLLDRQAPETDWGLRPRINGFLPVERSWSGDFERFKAQFPQGKEYQIAQKSIDEMEDLIRICQQKNIKVLLVFAPSYYASVYGYAKNVQEIFSVYRSMAGRNHVPFLDYSTLPMTKDTNYFYNSQHLNSKGAAYFSGLFAKNL